MNYAEIARRYAEGVVAGSIVAGRLAVAAAARHLADLERAAAGWDYYFDEQAAWHLCAFVEALPHVEGELAGQRIRLAPWQVFALASLNGWRRSADGLRRFRTTYWEMARKNGKSTMAAGPALYGLTCDGEGGAKVYTAATKAKQARLVFDIARNMAIQTPQLRTETGLLVQEHKLLVPGMNAEMRPLEASKLDGLNPSWSIVDELHEHRSRRVYDALSDAMGARTQPVMLTITTAGENLAHVCYEQRKYSADLLNGLVANETHFPLIYCLDAEDDAMDPAVWIKANPNLGVSKRLEYMAEEARTAAAIPAKLGEFMRKHCGIWTRMGASAIDLEGWRRGQAPVTRRDMRGTGAVVGLDLASRDDLAVVACVAPLPDGGIAVMCDHFASEMSLAKPGRETLQAWGREGRIEVHPGAMIDLDRVEEVVLARAEEIGAESIACDPHFAAQMMTRLSEAGKQVVEVRQTPMGLTVAFDRLMGLAEEGKVRHDGDPCLAWQASNVTARRVGEMWRMGHDLSEQKIDAVQAIVTALTLLAAPEESKEIVVPADYSVTV